MCALPGRRTLIISYGLYYVQIAQLEKKHLTPRLQSTCTVNKCVSDYTYSMKPVSHDQLISPLCYSYACFFKGLIDQAPCGICRALVWAVGQWGWRVYYGYYTQWYPGNYKSPLTYPGLRFLSQTYPVFPKFHRQIRLSVRVQPPHWKIWLPDHANDELCVTYLYSKDSQSK